MPSSLYNSLLLPDLRVMLDEHDDAGLAEFCKVLHPAVIAEVMEGLEPARTWEVLSHCDPAHQAEILENFSPADQIELVEAIDRPHLSRVIEEMSPDDRVNLLRRMDPEHVEALMPLIAQAERADIRKLLSYPDDSAGSLMTTEYASLPADITVAEALNRLRTQAPSRETIYYIYITDEDRHLLGFLSLRYLITARPSAKLSEIMERDVISVRVDDDREFVANQIQKYDFLAIPVVDHQNRLVGIVTYDDAADVLQEEATEDTHMLAAVQPLHDGYLGTPFFTLAWKRGIRLVILLAASSLTAHVLNFFESGAAGNWMVLFIPLVLASGGNAGSQSATLIIRALALGETDGQIRSIAWRELRLGALLGGIMGLLAMTGGWLLVESERASVVGLTVFCVVTVGTFAGALLPLALKKVGADPALMSNPMIASLSDMTGVVIFYNLARWLVSL
jgi:magnesium transporter